MSLFDMLAAPVALYALYAALTGEVYAKSGASGKTIARSDAPVDFWMTVVVYAGFAVALVTVF